MEGAHCCVLTRVCACVLTCVRACLLTCVRVPCVVFNLNYIIQLLPCRRKKKCVRYLQGEDIDCKDGLGCDADNDHHKPSCPAAHEPGCSIRDCSCDCNTHTCGGKFENAGAQTCGNEEKEDCTCKKEEVQGKGSSSTPNVVVCDSSKSSATTLHLASVANLSLTREASVTSVSSNMTSSAGPCSSFGRDQPRIFLSPQGAPEFGGQPGNVSTLSHYPNN